MVNDWNADRIWLDEEQGKKLHEVRPNQVDALKNVYELLSTEKVVLYLHMAVGFPLQATWIKAIQAGNYCSWPMMNVRNLKKYFPESDRTQKGHMRQTK